MFSILFIFLLADFEILKSLPQAKVGNDMKVEQKIDGWKKQLFLFYFLPQGFKNLI